MDELRRGQEVSEADVLEDLASRPAAHQQGSRPELASSTTELPGGTPDAFAAAAAAVAWTEQEYDEARARRLQNVPAFVHELHAALRDKGFGERTESEKIEALFGYSSSLCMGRNCSLNLLSLRRYGTLEVRRFHSTLDSTLAVRWAHFCVAFVDAFATLLPQEILSQPTADAALLALQLAQETATPSELVACMAGYIDPATVDYFLE